MDEPGRHDALNDLAARIDKAQNRGPGAAPSSRDTGAGGQDGLAMGMRIGLELVAGVAVGVGIGWLLHSWLGLGLWVFILCFFLGMAAGMANVYRAVKGLGLAVGYRPAGSGSPDRTPPGKSAEDWDEE